MDTRTSGQCDARGFMKKSLGILRVKTTSDVSSAIQTWEELARKYEKYGDKKYDIDLKLQRFNDTFSKPVVQQLVLEDRWFSERRGSETTTNPLDTDEVDGWD